MTLIATASLNQIEVRVRGQMLIYFNEEALSTLACAGTRKYDVLTLVRPSHPASSNAKSLTHQPVLVRDLANSETLTCMFILP